MKFPIAIIATCLGVALASCSGIAQPMEANPREVSAGGAKTASTSAWQHQGELDAGVKYLLDSQNEDGSFGTFAPRRPASITLGSNGSLKAFHNASTALAAMALMDLDRAEATTTAAHRAFTWLIDSPEALRATMAIFYNTWGQLYTIQALARGIGDPRFADLHQGMKKRAERELEILYDLQGLEGGFGYYDFEERTLQPSGKISTSFITAAVVVALHEAKQAGIKVAERRIELALNAIERQRGAEGAFVYSDGHILHPYAMPNRVEGSLCRSQACNYALKIWGRDSGTFNLERGISNFFQHHDYIEIARQRQYPHETWFKNAPYYYYFGHFYAAEILELLPDPAPAAAELGRLVARSQDEDGSFWDYPLYGYTKAYGTAYGVLVLNQCRKQLHALPAEALANRSWARPKASHEVTSAKPKGFQLATPEWRHEEALQAGIDYLVAHQHENGQFGSPESRRVWRIYLGGSNTLHAFGEGAHALAWMGLRSAPPSEAVNKALARGLVYMLNSPRTGRVNEKTFYNVWAHCYLLEAFAAAVEDPRFSESKTEILTRAQRELTSLMVLQAADGGFGYFDSQHRLSPPAGFGSTTFNTATALDAFAAANSMGLKVPEAVTNAALYTLEDMRLPSGAYLYARTHYYYPGSRANKVEGSLGRSQACNSALFDAGKLKPAQLKKSLDDLFQHHDYIEIARQRQLPHETWFANAPYYYYFGHLGAAKCIEKLEPADRPAYAASLADFVGASQDDDGCFWDMPLYDFGKAYGTGFAISTLLKCKAMIGADSTATALASAE